MTQAEFKVILLRYETGRASEEERVLVESWYDQRYNDLLFKDERMVKNPAETKARLLKNIEEAAVSFSDLKRKYRYHAWAMASAVAAIVVWVFFFSPHAARENAVLTKNEPVKKFEKQVVNATSVPLLVQLEDGTDVTLEPKSKLTGIDFSKAGRTVHLEGKAFFKVARDTHRPFYILTENIVTRVLGTSFIINAPVGREETVEVKTGRVAVYRKPEVAQVFLPDFFITVTPNHQVHFDLERQKLVTGIVEHPTLIPVVEPGEESAHTSAQEVPSFRMEFDGTPVEKIFKRLEAAYGVTIKYDAKKIANCSLTITLVDEDLFTRLQAVCDAIGGSYHVVGTEILIKCAGCNN